MAKNGGKCPVIGDNVDVGANSVITGDRIIGSNVLIAAGSVVVKDVPKHSLVAGNPASYKKFKELKKSNSCSNIISN